MTVDFCTQLICCFTILPLLGLLKVLIVILPVIGCIFIGCSGTVLLLWPRTLWYMMKAVVLSKQIGINIKVVLTLLTPVLCLLWVLLSIVGSALVTVAMGIVYPFVEIYANYSAEDRITLATSIFTTAWDIFRNFWTFNYDDIYKFSERQQTPNTNGTKFDISLTYILTAIFLGVYAMVVDGIFICLLSLIKFLPAMVRTWYEVTRGYLQSGCIVLTFVPYIVIMICVPAVCILGLGVAIIGGFLSGLIAIRIWYVTDQIGYGVRAAFDTVYQFDRLGNEWIFGIDQSALSCFSFTPPAAPLSTQPTQPPAAG